MYNIQLIKYNFLHFLMAHYLIRPKLELEGNMALLLIAASSQHAGQAQRIVIRSFLLRPFHSLFRVPCRVQCEVGPMRRECCGVMVLCYLREEFDVGTAV